MTKPSSQLIHHYWLADKYQRLASRLILAITVILTAG